MRRLRGGMAGLMVWATSAAAGAEGTSTGSEAPLNLLNPRITVIGNGILRVDDRKVTTDSGDRIDNRFNLNEVEFDMRAAVDPFADGVFITSIGSEAPGRYEASVEEGYAVVKSLPWMDRMPLGLSLKIGRFRPPIGLSNGVHTHDLPQTTRPLVVRKFLGDDGLVADGISASGIVPFSSDWAALDATLQVVNGGGLPAESGGGGSPAYAGRTQLFMNPVPSSSMTIGASAHHGKAGERDEAALGAVDVLYKWKPSRAGEWRSLLLGGEALRTFGRNAGDRGGYDVFGQWQFNRSLYAGLRWDRTQSPDSRASERQATPYVSYYFSEFLRFRFSWERTFDHADTVWGQVTVVIGAHPPEPYWVNR